MSDRIDAMADAANWNAANAHFADGDDDDYCAECGCWIDEDDGVRIDDERYCNRCAEEDEDEL